MKKFIMPQINPNEQWLVSPEWNYKNQNFTNSLLAKQTIQFYSITNFAFKQWHFWATILIFYLGLFIYGIFATILFLIYPDFRLQASTEIRKLLFFWYILARIIIPFSLGTLFMIYLIIVTRKNFLSSGIFAIYFYVLSRSFIAILNFWAFKGSVSTNFLLYSNWINLIILLLIFITAAFFMPDLRRAFLLIFNKAFSVNFFLANKDPRLVKTILKNDDRPRNLVFSGNIILWFILAVIIFSFISSISGSLGGLISRIFNRKNSNQASINADLNSNINPFYVNKLPLILTIIIFAPLVEELAFRISIINLGNNKIYSVLIAGLIFGMIHVHSDGWFNIFSYAFFGLGLAFAYSITGNYWIVFCIHCLNNVISLIF